MSKIKELSIDNHFPLLIEVEEGELEVDIQTGALADIPDAPAGATPKTREQAMVKSMDRLKDNIGVIAMQVKEALEGHEPNEWGVEFSMSFKGEAMIPCLLKSEASGTLKITAKWKK